MTATAAKVARIVFMRELMVEFNTVSAVLNKSGVMMCFKISVLARQKKALIAWMDRSKPWSHISHPPPLRINRK